MSETVVVCVRAPEVPVMVTVTVPVAAAADAERVNALVVAVEVGLKEALTPPGKPDAERVTFPEKPLKEVTVMVLPLELPCTTVTLEGEAVSPKSEAAVPGQALTRLATLMEPMPEAKSQPVVLP